jgi:Chitin synthase export chaperone
MLIMRANRRKAAVGRREIQIFLVFYLFVSICDIFTTGRFLQLRHDFSGLRVLASLQVGLITAMFWTLLLWCIVQFQFLKDGTILSIGLIISSATIFFIGTTYIALDTSFSFTGSFNPGKNCVNVGLYILYLGLPLVSLLLFFVLQFLLVSRLLGKSIPLCTF